MGLVSKFRPSPAMIVALLALFLAVGGVGYAASQINGKNLKNHSVSGKKLKKNTLTGRQIKESKLGKVPSAGTADTATTATTAGHATTADTATNADKLDGQDSTAFLPAGGTAVDSQKLGGQDPTAFSDASLPVKVITGNGVGNNFGCGGDLGVEVLDGRNNPVDDRFTFQVPGTTPAWGQIRSDGSIRDGSPNVASVTHTTGTGVYCVHVTGSGFDFEGTVGALHDN